MKILHYIVLISIFFVNSFALTLQSEYETSGKNIMASQIYKDIPKDFIFYTYDQNEHMLRSNITEIAAIFKKHGFDLKFDGARYVTFREKSTIDTSLITEMLQKEFLQKYKTIEIKSLLIIPRAYITELPKEYSLKLQHQTLYQNHSTFAIITPEHKMIFFDYVLDATIDVLVTTTKVARHEMLGMANTVTKKIQFLNFKATPLSDITNHQYQSKFSLKSDTILTQNDVELFSVVKRDDVVNAFIEDGGVSISFEAVAVQDGKVGDTITIRKPDGKELKAKVVASKRVEVE